MAIPSGVTPAMGTNCKSNTGTPTGTFICASSSSFSTTAVFYIWGNDMYSNLAAWDTTNQYFFFNWG